MLSFAHLFAIIAPTVAVALLVRWWTKKADAVLLMLSGAASLMLAFFASIAMQVDVGESTMTLQMSEESFRFGILPPVFVVATLAFMRGLFRFLQV